MAVVKIIKSGYNQRGNLLVEWWAWANDADYKARRAPILKNTQQMPVKANADDRILLVRDGKRQLISDGRWVTDSTLDRGAYVKESARQTMLRKAQEVYDGLVATGELKQDQTHDTTDPAAVFDGPTARGNRTQDIIDAESKAYDPETDGELTRA